VTEMSEVLNKKERRYTLIISLLIGSIVGCLPLFMHSSILILAIVVGLGTVILLVIYKPHLGLGLTFVYMIIAPYFLQELNYQGIGLALLTLFILLGIILRIGTSKRLTTFNTPLDIPIFCLLIWTVISAGYGVIRGNELYALAGDFFQVTVFIVFYYYAKLTIRKKKEVIHLFLFLTIPIIFFSVVNFMQYLFSGTFNWVAAEIAGRTIYRLQAPVTLYVTILLVITICLAIYSRSFLKSALLLCLIIFLSGMLFFSFTRSFLLGFLVAAVFIIITQITKRKNILLYLVVAVVGLLVLILISSALTGMGKVNVVNILLERFGKSFGKSDIATNVRIDEIISSVKLICLHPILGIGLGGKFWFFNEQVPAWEWRDYIHNSYLFFALKMGLPALGIYLWLAVIFLFKGLKKIKSVQDNYLKGLGYGFISAYFGLAITSLTLPMLNYFLLVPYIGVTMALVFNLDKLRE